MHTIRGVSVAVAILATLCGILAGFLHVDGGLIGHALAVIRFI
jgi:hypothetical protein